MCLLAEWVLMALKSTLRQLVQRDAKDKHADSMDQPTVSSQVPVGVRYTGAVAVLR